MLGGGLDGEIKVLVRHTMTSKNGGFRSSIGEGYMISQTHMHAHYNTNVHTPQ